MSQKELFELVVDGDESDEGESLLVLEEVSPDELGISKKDQEEFGRNKDVEAAISWIDMFFAGKQMYYGGDIPPAVLHSPAYIDRVLNLDMVTGIKEAYELIEITGAIETSCDEESIPADVSIVVGLLEECHRSGVPKYYAAGIVLIALELCYGVTPPLRMVARSGF